MKLLREMLSASLPSTLEEGLKWLETDPWASLVNEGTETKTNLELAATIKVFEQFMTGERTC